MFNASDEIIIDDSRILSEPSLVYICGYASFKIKNKLAFCEMCTNFITQAQSQIEDDLDNFKYLNDLNRGELSIPSDTVVLPGKHIYYVMNHLIPKKFEMDFLKCENKRKLLIQLTNKGFDFTLFNTRLSSQIYYDNCVCGSQFKDVINKLLKTMSNILLNNYTKVKNNSISQLSAPKKRKLLTVL
ncbi:hypothetical protein HHI36_006519 [Cryptolaemus montrouzieri]|uniref:Uncharacterized protein n=1 Tax=Cryptolaemus montrouzieri TaxID=559131 RepID=A0ABD2NXC0_9CUCU